MRSSERSARSKDCRRRSERGERLRLPALAERDRFPPCRHGRRRRRRQRLEACGASSRADPAPRRGPGSARRHRLAQVRDRQRPRVSGAPCRSARRVGSGDPRRGSELRTGSRAHLPVAATWWAQAVSRARRMAPIRALPERRAAAAGGGDHRCPRRSTPVEDLNGGPSVRCAEPSRAVRRAPGGPASRRPDAVGDRRGTRSRPRLSP